MDREEILATYADWEAATQKVAELWLDALTHTELLASASRRFIAALLDPISYRRG